MRATGSLPASAQRLRTITGEQVASGTRASGRRFGSPSGTKDGSPRRQRQPGVLASFGTSVAPAGAKENSVHWVGNVTRHSPQIFRPCRGLRLYDRDGFPAACGRLYITMAAIDTDVVGWASTLARGVWRRSRRLPTSRAPFRLRLLGLSRWPLRFPADCWLLVTRYWLLMHCGIGLHPSSVIVLLLDLVGDGG